MVRDMNKVRVTGKKDMVTFAYMRLGAKHMLKLAEESQKGQLYLLVASLIFSAFTLEAYLNHLGKLRNKEWDEIERKYPKLDKYKLFSAAANVRVDFGVRPYRTLIELFNFRDHMAHGKTIREQPFAIDVNANEDYLPQILVENDWQAAVTLEMARHAIADVEVLIKELHSSSGFSDNPFNKLGGASYSVAQKST